MGLPATFEIYIGENGKPEIGEDFLEFCHNLEKGKHYITIRKDNPESRWTLLMCRSIHGDMNMLSRATDFNVSPQEWKDTCKLMKSDLFVRKLSIRNPITGERKETLRSLTDPELSRADILDWMKCYRENMERVWYNGNPELDIKPLKNVYHWPVLYWYTRNDQWLREFVEGKTSRIF